MAKVKRYLFSWQDVEAKSDLHRLELVIETIPDESLMRKLEGHRGRGRNDYPVRCMWNAMLAGVVYQHGSIESLRRELERNGELRQLCGFDPFLGSAAVPSAAAFTHFLKNLLTFTDEIEAMFHELVEELGQLLPDFGERVAIDGKAIQSAGKPSLHEEQDGRREMEADWGKHEYKGKRKDGSVWKKVKSWFGYKLHLLVDAQYELPLGFDVTRASASEVKQVMPLIEKHRETHPKVGSRCKELYGDRGYDDRKIIQALYDKYDIKPVIDIRNCWNSKGDEMDRVEGQPVTRQLNPYHSDNIVYDYRGGIYCVCSATQHLQSMSFSGFEKDRKTLKYTCPVKAYGMTCQGMSGCEHCNKSIRIPLSINRRLFTPIARSSYKWRRHYRLRTSVERVNSRLDVSFGFENHTIRGLKKMGLRVGVALIIMLSMALGHVKAGRKEVMRSLVKSIPRLAKAA
ncbi:MAG: transposase [Thermodesulfobacteriota bacterium]